MIHFASIQPDYEEYYLCECGNLYQFCVCPKYFENHPSYKNERIRQHFFTDFDRFKVSS